MGGLSSLGRHKSDAFESTSGALED